MSQSLPQPVRVFGLVVRQDDHLILSRSTLPLGPVLLSLQAGLNEERLLKDYTGLQADEIKAAKAYLARFGPDIDHPSPLREGPKSLLLDENIPYTLLPFIVQQFGWSTHVEAEGLSRQNLADQHKVPRSALDSRIARFAAANGFAGIVTKDKDFIELYSYPGHPVRNINVVLIDEDGSPSGIEKRLSRHQDQIRRQLASPTPDLIRI